MSIDQPTLLPETYMPSLIAFLVDQLGGSVVLTEEEIFDIASGKWELSMEESREFGYRAIYRGRRTE